VRSPRLGRRPLFRLLAGRCNAGRQVRVGAGEAESLRHEGDRLAGAVVAVGVAEPYWPADRHRHQRQRPAVGRAHGGEVDQVGKFAWRGALLCRLLGRQPKLHREQHDVLVGQRQPERLDRNGAAHRLNKAHSGTLLPLAAKYDSQPYRVGGIPD
jgi:hypothetical protein